MPSVNNSGGGFGGYRPGQSERSTDDIKNDVKKPLLIALWSAVPCIMVPGLVYLVIWLVWKRSAPWAARQWFREWQDILLTVPVGLWMLIWIALLGRWLFNLVNDHWPPAYGPANPENGLMGPLWGLVRSIRTMGLFRDPFKERYNKLFGNEDSIRDFIEQAVKELRESEET